MTPRNPIHRAVCLKLSDGRFNRTAERDCRISAVKIVFQKIERRIERRNLRAAEIINRKLLRDAAAAEVYAAVENYSGRRDKVGGNRQRIAADAVFAHGVERRVLCAALRGT